MSIYMDNYSHEIIDDDTRLQLYFMLLTSNNHYSPLHWHGHLEIIYIQEGFMDAYISDRKYALKKNDMLVIGSRELHATRTWGGTDYVLLQIPTDYLSRVLSNVSLIQFQEYFSAAGSTDWEQLSACLLELVKTYTEKADGYQLHFSSLVYEFLYLLYRNHSFRISSEAREKENRNFERMEEIIQYVKAHYKQEISLNDAAKLIHVSPEYFCRLFKKHTGQTFLEYVNAVRLTNFHRELFSTDYSITDLMARSGITNYKVFIRTFKDTYGTTPARLRAQAYSATPKGIAATDR